MNNAACPVCHCSDLLTLYPEHAGVCVTSDMKILDSASIHNRCCQQCGLIFNASGTREFTNDFYEKAYSLMMRNEDAAIQNFNNNKPQSQAELTKKILSEMVALPANGSLLEIGAGKGEFLNYFSADYPQWELHAFEPTAAVSVLEKRLPSAQVQRCQYQEFVTDNNDFDVIVALGVLEHVSNPLDMLQWGAKVLKPGGIFYLRVPNFANNPNDLFCADHLSKLTVPTLENLAAAAGYEVIATKEGGVPVFMALRKTGEPQTLQNNFVANQQIAEKNITIAKESMQAIITAHQAAKTNNENFAIFGLGAVGLFAPFYADFDVADISAYLDENQTLWGSEIHGRPVGGLDFIAKHNIAHVALAISPVYIPQVSEKLKAHGVAIYSA